MLTGTRSVSSDLMKINSLNHFINMEFRDMLIAKRKNMLTLMLRLWLELIPLLWKEDRRVLLLLLSLPIVLVGVGRGCRCSRSQGTQHWTTLHPYPPPGTHRGHPEGAGPLFHRAFTSLLADARFIHGITNYLSFPISWALHMASQCF